MTSISLRLRHLLAAVFLLPLVCACQSSRYDNDDDPAVSPQPPMIATDKQYINLHIVVSSGSESATRAIPNGGENGDGREKGLERENYVKGITLMLYELDNQTTDDAINNSKDKTLAFVKYYPVRRLSINEATQTGYNSDVEAVYTTDNQSLKGSNLDLTKKYGVLVVANMDLEGELTTQTTVKQVCDHLTTEIYEGTGLGADANNFVMSLEKDYIMEFKGEPNVNGETYYIFDEAPIYIERLAARVDFWTINSTGYATEYNGYVYPVKDNENDQFVLTAVTPFNFYANATGEYLIKRLGGISTDNKATDISYLAEEPGDQSKYVLDPYTLYKTTPPSTPAPPLILSYTHPLSGTFTEGAMPMSAFQDGGTYKDALIKYTDKTDNLIICYPKENTLPKDAPLYNYATGLCIEGDYYIKGWETAAEPDGSNPKVEHLVYYGFLRHEGESTEAYDIYTKEELDEKMTDLKSAFPMNFGVVRNNIYRISIGTITEKGPKMELQIEVKKWDKFEHKTIFM